MYQPATYILDYTQYDDPDLNESQKSGPKSPPALKFILLHTTVFENKMWQRQNFIR